MEFDTAAAAIVLLLLLAALGFRGLAAFLVGLWLISVLQPSAYAAYATIVGDPELSQVAGAAFLGCGVALVIGYRWIYNALVAADLRRDIDAAKAKAEKRRI